MVYWQSVFLNKNKAGTYFRQTAVWVLMLSLLTMGSCKYPSGPPNPNTWPETRLANVPVTDPTAQYIALGAIPELTLYWRGDDPDGFVIAYHYRWFDSSNVVSSTRPPTTILNITNLGAGSAANSILVRGNPTSVFRIYNFLTTLAPTDTTVVRVLNDSLVTRRPFAVPYSTGHVPGDSICGANNDINPTPTTGTFIFDSPADSNLHRFEIAAIDNNDVADPSPASVVFWTQRSPVPTVLFTVSVTSDTNAIPFAIRYVTETFQGLRFAFTARDPSTFEHEYSWSVDDTVSWSNWSANPEAYVTALNLNPIQSGVHTFYVRVRNRWGTISAIADTNFNVLVPEIDDPTYPRRTLIINNDLNGNGTIGNPDSNQVKAFYAEVMDSLGRTGQFDIYTTATPRPPVLNTAVFPSRKILATYSSVLLVSEQPLPIFGFPGTQKIRGTQQGILTDYLNIGGKLIFSSPTNIREVVNPWTTFPSNMLHILPPSIFPFTHNTQRDFIGAKGLLGYPTIMVDSLKLPADSGGALRYIAINIPRGFGQSISLFDSRSNDPVFEDRPLGVRFLAPEAVPPARQTYSTVFFGFPLYYAEKSSVIQALRQAFIDIRE